MLLALTSVSAQASTTAGQHSSCSVVAFTVDVTPTEPATMRGTLCLPATGHAATIEVLLSGLTYDSIYWELPAATGLPSYQQALNTQGYATLAIDRLGTGLSSRPPSADVTFDTEVATLHQVVTDIHAGLAGHHFTNLVLVGHSFGSALAIGDAANHPGDSNAIVLSGWAHAEGADGTAFENVLVNADTDPVTGPGNPPAGYLTTQVGSRGTYFYNSADASPTTIQLDEATKSTMTTGELDSLEEPYDPTLAANVTVPILMAIGSDDELTCGTELTCSSAAEIVGYESQLFTSTPSLQAYLLPDAGHSINLARNAPTWFAASVNWTKSLGL
jgi:pimeloyl-ACP methyl ester carboxylesterase